MATVLRASLLLLLAGKSTYPLFGPLFQFPTSSSTSSEHIPREERRSFSPFILEREAVGAQSVSLTLSITFNHPPFHVYSALRPLQLPLSFAPSHLSSFSLVSARPCLQALPPCRLPAADEGISELISQSFHYFSSTFNWLRCCHIASAQRLRLCRLITAVLHLFPVDALSFVRRLMHPPT